MVKAYLMFPITSDSNESALEKRTERLTSDSLSLEEPRLPKLWLEHSLFVKVCTEDRHNIAYTFIYMNQCKWVKAEEYKL